MVEVRRPGDVGVVQPERRLGFPLEPLEVRLFVHPFNRQYLDRYRHLHAGMLSQVNGAHAPLAEFPPQFVLPEKVAAVLALAELPNLPVGKQISLFEGLGQGLGKRARRPLPRSDDLVEAGVFDQAAFSQRGEKALDGVGLAAHVGKATKERWCSAESNPLAYHGFPGLPAVENRL